MSFSRNPESLWTPGNSGRCRHKDQLPYFDPNAFSTEANNFDMALLKDTHITESKVLQVRFEFFNVFNHV
jgi:hypothetical protein